MGGLKIKHKIATFSVVMAENNLYQGCLYIYIAHFIFPSFKSFSFFK